MPNCFLKIVELKFLSDLEKCRVVLCEIESEFKIVLFFILAQTKPAPNVNAPKRDIIWSERKDVCARVAFQ